MLNIIRELKKHNVSISLNQEELELNFEGDLPGDDIVELVRTNKQELKVFLQKYAACEHSASIAVQKKQANYALSPAQFRIWLVSQAPEASVAYNVPNTHFLQGQYHLPTLEQAIGLTVKRHESLRTVFKKDDKGDVRQWILDWDEVGFCLEQYDFSQEAAAEEKARAVIKEDATTAFDLENGPLLSVKLFRVAPEAYLFYYNMHHIISDTWSLEILVRDVMSFYQALLLEQPPALPALPIQYKDYSAWINDQLLNDQVQLGRAYWKEKLKGSELPTLTLPGAKLRPKIKSYRGAVLETYLDKADVNALRSFCAQQNMSLYMGLLSVWNFLLYRYTGNEDLLVGTGVAGREHLDLENQIGCFINLVPFRTGLTDQDTFLSLCQKVKDTTLEAYEYQAVPFDVVLKDIELRRDPSRNPLFDTMLFLQNAKENKGSTQLSPEQLDRVVLKGEKGALTDIDINFIEQGEYLVFSTVFNTDIYEESFIRALVAHYKVALPELLRRPALPLNEIDFLSQPESQSLEVFNATARPYRTQTTICELFEEQVRACPSAVALICGPAELTYEQLNREVNLLASFLIQHYGTKTEDLIALKLERTEWLIIAMLAVIKAGGAYIPIDPNNPESRTTYILQDSQACLLIDQEFIQSYRQHSRQECETLPAIAAASNLAYVIYTSGSTGNPKGVMIEHRNLISFFANLDEKFCFDAVSTIAATTNYTFDISVLEILGSLCSGKKLILFREEELVDSRKFIDTLKQEKVELLQLTPSRLSLVLELTNKIPTSVKVMLVGGEALPLNQKNELLANNPALTLINVYGPTETTIWSTSGVQRLESKVDIGSPLFNENICLYSRFPHLAPMGVVGELAIAGDGVGRGYLNRPALSRQKFITHRINGELKPLYFTGDLARWLPNGTIEFVGRKDSQVKIRGHRIELCEIESKILGHPGIKQTVVAQKQIQGAAALVAYLIPAAPVDKRELREYLLSILPEYMVPGFYVELSGIPLNASGKVDFINLPDITEEDGIKTEYEPPATEKEKILVQLAEQLLGRNQIGLNDNYFDLGGDSTKIIRLISLLNKHALNLDVEHIFKAVNFKELALQVYSKNSIADQAEVTGAVHISPIANYFFSSPGFKKHQHFNLNFLLESKAPIPSRGIEQCFQKLIEHHDALRLSYRQDRHGTWQGFNKKVSGDALDYYFYDLRKNSAARQEMKEVASQIQASFILDKGPLIKVAHFRLATQDYIALFIHHLVVDMHSLRILLEDLNALYKNYQEGAQLSLPLKTDSYQLWTSYLARFNETVLTNADKNYWTSISAQAIPRLPSEYSIPDQLNLKLSKHASFKLGEESSEQFRQLNLSNVDNRIDGVVLTALALALEKTWGVRTSVVRFETPGRESGNKEIDVSRTVGWFTAIYPHILRVEGASLESDFRIVSQDLQKIPKNKLGYGTLGTYSSAFSEVLLPSIDYTFMGNLLNGVEEDTQGFVRAYEDLGSDTDPDNGRDVLLDIKCSTIDQNLTLNVSYSPAAYSVKLITKFLDCYRGFLESLVSHLHQQGIAQNPQVGTQDLLAAWMKGGSSRATQRQKEILKAGSFMGIIGPIQLDSHLRAEEVEQKFRDFMRLTPVLCTAFEFGPEEEVYQNYIEPAKVKIEVRSEKLDLTNYSELKNTIYPYLSQNFKLREGGNALIRLFVGSGLGPTDKDILFLSIHHALTDERSNQLIQDRLQKFLRGEVISLKINHNLELANFEPRFRASEEGAAQASFWSEYLGNCQLSQPRSRPATFGSMTDCIMQKCILSGPAFQSIEEKSRQLKLPISAILLAKYQKALRTLLCTAPQFMLLFSNGRDVVLDEFGDEQALGAFNDFLILSCLDQADSEFEDYARQLYVAYMQARMNQKLAYGTVRENYRNSTGNDLDGAIAGTFDLHLHNGEECPDLFDGKIETSQSLNDFTRGIDLVSKLYTNGIEFRLVYPKHYRNIINSGPDLLGEFIRIVCN